MVMMCGLLCFLVLFVLLLIFLILLVLLVLLLGLDGPLCIRLIPIATAQTDTARITHLAVAIAVAVVFVVVG